MMLQAVAIERDRRAIENVDGGLWLSCICAFALPPGGMVSKCMQIPLDPTVSAAMPQK
jgi:hypothetical protein